MPKAAHKMVAKVAREAAGELYEKMMGDQQFYAEWKRQNPGLSPRELEARFISKNWGRCLAFARATLATLLQSSLDTESKEAIMEALVLDATLRPGRRDFQIFEGR